MNLLSCTFITIFIVQYNSVRSSKAAVYTYTEYQYKDNPKNNILRSLRNVQEMTFREFETACEQSSACAGQAGLQRMRCLRECVSPSCYREIYHNDQLEEGEIDVRLNSFKGCFIQRTGRTRN